jgi:ABC-type uncharacterized transport system substrate-binding protein
MKRREFIALFGGAAAWPFAARSQQPPMPVIGFLSSRSPGESAKVVEAFQQGLREAQFVEGQNVAITFRWAEGRYDLLPALVAELVNRKVDCILAAGGPPTVVAAKAATTSIPVVFIANNPVELGIVASLDRPGGNLTGIGLLVADLVAKQLEFLKEVVPQASALAYLQNPKSPTAALNEGSVRDAARALGIKLNIITVMRARRLSWTRRSSRLLRSAPAASSSKATHTSTASASALLRSPPNTLKWSVGRSDELKSARGDTVSGEFCLATHGRPPQCPESRQPAADAMCHFET